MTDYLIRISNSSNTPRYRIFHRHLLNLAFKLNRDISSQIKLISLQQRFSQDFIKISQSRLHNTTKKQLSFLKHCPPTPRNENVSSIRLSLWKFEAHCDDLLDRNADAANLVHQCRLLKGRGKAATFHKLAT